MIGVLGVCRYRLALRCGRCPVGFELMAAVGSADAAPSFMLGKFLGLVTAFHTRVFLLYLVYLAVDGKPDFRRGT